MKEIFEDILEKITDIKFILKLAFIMIIFMGFIFLFAYNPLFLLALILGSMFTFIIITFIDEWRN